MAERLELEVSPEALGGFVAGDDGEELRLPAVGHRPRLGA
jgi:hypothetical protein